MSDVTEVPSQVCTKCGTEKPLSEFYAQSDRGRPRRDCKTCNLAHAAQWRAENRHKLRAWYGICDEGYDALMEQQSGVCAICKQPETHFTRGFSERYPLQVDHDHNCCSGRRRCGECTRGLLCGRCNRALGLLQDDAAIVAAAAAYLARGVVA